MARDRDYRRRGRPGTSNRASLRCLASASRRPGPSAKARRFRKWVALTLRQPYQCMVPAHGSSFETPTRHHTRRRGRPIPRRLLLGWSERVRIRQRLRAHICAGSGRTPGATPKKQRRHHARTRRGFFKNPRLFCAPTSTSKEEPGSVRGGQAVLDEARPRRQYRQAAGAACASDQGPPHFRRASSIDSSRSGGRLKGLICPINAIWSRRRIRPFKRART